MSTPLFTQTEALCRDTFLALMWALTHPGTQQRLPGDVSAYPASFLAIGDTLLDLEASYHTPDTSLAAELARTTARQDTLERAEYLFYPSLAESMLPELKNALAGTMQFPDRSATIIIGCTFGAGPRVKLTGPGIETANVFEIQGIPTGFWALRESVRRYPLGWDLFLVSGGNVIGIPRSANLELVESV